MKKLLYIFLITSLSLTIKAQTPYYFYNYEGEKVYLSLNTKYAFLSVKEQQLPVDIQRRNIKVEELQPDKSDQKHYQNKKGTCRYYTTLSFDEKISDEQYLDLLSDMKRQNKNVIISPFFKFDNDDIVGLSNFFYVKLKHENDTTLLRQVAEQIKCIIIEQDPFMPLWFVLSTTAISKLNAMECSNIFYESGLFQAAEPNLMIDVKQCANDQHFNFQWGLNNTGQYSGTSGIDIKACDAWQISRGDNVVVAIIDNGIKLNHDDLEDNIFPLSFDSENRTSPSIIRGDHGTPCSGIVGALQNNSNKGISGVAPNCQLMSISSSLDLNTLNIQQHLAAGINWAWQNGADVISNSWGHDALQGAYITDAISNAVTQGRGGNGCVVVFAAGNENKSTISYPAKLPNVIAVGAMSQCGTRKRSSNKQGDLNLGVQPDPAGVSCDDEKWWGSNYGSDLDVVAPGVKIYTTTINGGYRSDFNGTSAACPFVAGVAALVLSVNPCLTQEEVREVISLSCEKVGGYCYTPGKPYGLWNNQMGYGLVNAYKAVKYVFTDYNNFSNISGTTYTTTNNVNLTLYTSGCSGVASGSYRANMHEIRATVNYPYTQSPIIKGNSNGFSGGNPNSGNYYMGIVSSSETSTTVRTWVYEVINTLGQTIGWIPTTPANVRFNITIDFDLSNDYFFQNKTEAGNVAYHAINKIEAGKNVTNSVPVGNYTVQSGANVTFHAGNKIVLKDGFKVEAGAVFKAYIEPFFSCTYSAPSPVAPPPDNGDEYIPMIKSYFVEKTDYPEAEEQQTGKESEYYLKLYPNPSSGDVTIEYNLNQSELVEITLYDNSGKLIYKLKNNSTHDTGIYQIKLSGVELPTGTYLCKLQTDNNKFITEKLIIVR